MAKYAESLLSIDWCSLNFVLSIWMMTEPSGCQKSGWGRAAAPGSGLDGDGDGGGCGRLSLLCRLGARPRSASSVSVMSFVTLSVVLRFCPAWT